MAMLARLLPTLPSTSSRRAYSFFSSKPGGGRYFNPNKSHKVAVVKSTAVASPTNPSLPGSPDASSQALPSVADAGALSGSSPAVDSEPYVTPSQAMAAAFGEAQIPRFHPNPNLPTLQLHNFFALERPLLLLSQPTSSLFDPIPQATPTATSGLVEAMGMSADYPDADVDAARLLARSLVMQRVGSTMDWSEVMAKLGAQEEMVIEMDSVKRKRRKKMNKHRYKKRRKLQRAERRRLKK